MTVYENAALYSKNRSIFETIELIDTDDSEAVARIQALADEFKEPIYLLREFIAVDAKYQDVPPRKLAKDWFVLEFIPQ